VTDVLRKQAPDGSLRRRASAFLPVVVLSSGLALTLLSLSAFAASQPSGDGRAPGGDLQNPVVRAVDVASPAAVRLATIYTGHITLELARCGRAVTLPASGSGYTVGGLGSGAFISGDGNILTADHVVNIDQQELDGEIFQASASARDIAKAVNACYTDLSFPISAADVGNGVLSELGIAYTTSYSAPRFLVWRDTAWTGKLASGSSSSQQDILTALLSVSYSEASIAESSVFAQDDLAILHVNLSDTPSIQLGSSNDVAVQDPLTILGFPGNGDFNSDPTDLLTISVNNVMVSAIKQNDNGSPLIQVGGNVEHGDSGGPALDARGGIVGVVSFGGTDTPGITAFLRASVSAQRLIAAVGISTAPGRFQALWQRAFADYAATTPGHWHMAAQEMKDLSTSYPSFQAIMPYVRYAQEQAASEPTGRLDVSHLPLGVIGGAGLVALLVFGGVGVLSLRSRRKAARQAAVPAGAYAAPGFGQGSVYGGAPTLPPAGVYGGGVPANPSHAYGSYGGAPGGSNGHYGPYVGPRTPSAGSTGSTGTAGALNGAWPGSQAMGLATPPTSVPPAAGANAPPGSGTSPFLPSSYGEADGAATTPAAASSASSATSGAEVCLNGHALRPSVVSCELCGAPRRARS
jgi:hypothetical protein